MTTQMMTADFLESLLDSGILDTVEKYSYSYVETLQNKFREQAEALRQTLKAEVADYDRYIDEQAAMREDAKWDAISAHFGSD